MKLAYTAFDKSGKAVSGTADANSAAEARETLRRQGLFVTDIRETSATDLSYEAAAASRGGANQRIGTGRRLKNLAMFSRQLHVLVGSGTPIVQALAAIERQCEHENWRLVIAELRKRVEEGAPLSEAMRQQSAHFDAVCRSLIAAGESSGNLPQMLDRLANLSRKQLHLRSSVLGAMVYPCMLIMLGITVLIVMLLFVLPRFAGLFSTLDAPLPPTTKLLMWLSGLLRSYWWAALIGAAGGGFGLRAWVKSTRGKETIDTTSLNVPKFGRLMRSLMTARLARMLGTLLESRVPLLDALQLTRQSLMNLHYVKLIARAEESVGRGEPISAVLSSSDLISACVQEAVRNGEQTGQIGTPLVQMADFLDEENDVVVKSLTSIIEPMILIVLGVLVGFIAISMFLPLFDLVSAAHG
jgi:type II secretory pathway component PulF